jgi:uncharacterized membrane protein YoaT (DUF817 family)
LRLGGVPLFSGFMYASIGSYIARAWRLFDFRFTHHPSFAATWWLAMAIYVNFFTHHFLPDARGCCSLRGVLFGRTGFIFESGACIGACRCCLAFVLVATFIWFAENIGTFTAAWRYPAQRHAWSMVPLSKLGAWLLLMIISYVMVSAVAMHGEIRRSRDVPLCSLPCEQGRVGKGLNTLR